jgi:hypothetical protein
MSATRIPPVLREGIAERARHRCSYCQTAESVTGSFFTVDHVIPEALGGRTTAENLCLACWECNRLKRARIAGVDPDSGAVVRLFNPNAQGWHEHFAWQNGGLLMVGLTPTGRATVTALQLNRVALVNARRLWILAGWHPPVD